MRVGFVGAGNIGQGLARLAIAAGYEVVISNSRGPQSLRDVSATLGIEARTVADVVRTSEVVVVAIPYARVFEMDASVFDGKVVLDANNYYPRRDGQVVELDSRSATTSGLVQRHFADAIVVKAFNAILARDLTPPFGMADGRRALPIAGNDPSALASVTDMHERLGFGAVVAGDLDDSWRFERAKPAYCIPLRKPELVEALKAAQRSVDLPHNSWHRDVSETTARPFVGASGA